MSLLVPSAALRRRLPSALYEFDMDINQARKEVKKKEIAFALGIFARLYIVVITWFFYIGHFWFYEYISTLEKVFGVVFIPLSLITIFIPRKTIGAKNWSYLFWVSNVLFLLWLVYKQSA